MYKLGFIYGTRIPLTQSLAVLMGLTIAVVISLFDYRDFIRMYKIYVPVGVVLMLLTFTPLAYKRAEANDRAWINLGFTTFQPSEFLKIVFVLSFAYHLSKVQEDINSPKVLLRLLIHAGAAIGLVFLQNDFGTATVFIAVFLAMMFASGISWKYVAGAIGAAIPLLLIAWFFILDDYHKLRIFTVFNPELDPLGIGYQPMQGKISIGSGMFFGKGLLSPELRNIPEVYNDFMFAFIGEALGYLGATIVIIILLVIIARIILTGMSSNDREGYFICVGIFMIFAWQIIINMGMCVGLAPVIGITLPFVSAGGSSVVMLYMSIGIVLSVYNHNRKTVFG
jgi:rod shape determining protein RodA